MKTVLTFDDICNMLNSYHNDPEYIISFKVHNGIHLVKYGSRLSHSEAEMKALIKEAREEFKTLNDVMTEEGV